jgi:glycosyltransferase involved in cell wall biosynthesis
VAVAGLDIVVLTSFNEGTPVSLIEAQSGNKPVISTKVGGIEDIVFENETALLIQNNNLPELIQALNKLLENDEMRKSMGKNGWEKVGGKFSYNRLAGDMEKFYQEIIATHRF